MTVKFSLGYSGLGDVSIGASQCSRASFPSAYRFDADGKRHLVTKRLFSELGNNMVMYSGPVSPVLPSGKPCRWSEDLNHWFIIDKPGKYVFETATDALFQKLTAFKEAAEAPKIRGPVLTISVSSAASSEVQRRIRNVSAGLHLAQLGDVAGIDGLAEIQDEGIIPIILNWMNEPQANFDFFAALNTFCDRDRLNALLTADLIRRHAAHQRVAVDRYVDALASLEVWSCASTKDFRADARKDEIAAARSRWQAKIADLLAVKH